MLLSSVIQCINCQTFQVKTGRLISEKLMETPCNICGAVEHSVVLWTAIQYSAILCNSLTMTSASEVFFNSVKNVYSPLWSYLSLISFVVKHSISIYFAPCGHPSQNCIGSQIREK